jgi:AcrR family transcriptional regulator
MQERVPNTDARERVLEAAERLFARKGYTAVTLRDIAAEVGIRHTSLYHHVPGGKEELFIEVTEREFERHRSGLLQALNNVKPEIQAQLYAVADWLLSQPPVDLLRMGYVDMPAIDALQAERLTRMAYASILSPIEAALEQAEMRGEIKHHDFGLIAGGLLGMIEALFSVPEHAFFEEMHLEETGVPLPVQGRQRMAYELIAVMLSGLRVHDSSYQP